MSMTRDKGNADEASKQVAVILGGTGTALSIAALAAALTRPAEAAPPTEGEQVIINEAIKQALAAMLMVQSETLTTLQSMQTQLDSTNKMLRDILPALGAAPPEERRILEPFLKEAQKLNSKEQFNICEQTGRGSLVWAVIDVSDPNTKISFKFDGLVWDFTLTTLYNEGIQQPLFPGVWLTKYDADSGHYTIIFSAGTLEGFSFESKMIIYATYLGTGTATLIEARGIKWGYH